MRNKAPGRIPDWAGHVALHEVGEGNELVAVSKTIPQEAVDAYMDGWSQAWGFSVPVRSGAVLRTQRDGTYEGADEWIDSYSVLVTLMRQEDRVYELGVDSYNDANQRLMLAKRQVMANPQRQLKEKLQGKVTEIYADPEEPKKSTHTATGSV